MHTGSPRESMKLSQHPAVIAGMGPSNLYTPVTVREEWERKIDKEFFSFNKLNLFFFTFKWFFLKYTHTHKPAARRWAKRQEGMCFTQAQSSCGSAGCERRNPPLGHFYWNASLQISYLKQTATKMWPLRFQMSWSPHKVNENETILQFWWSDFTPQYSPTCFN